MRLDGDDPVVRLLYHRVQFREVQLVFRNRGLHGALLRVGVQRAAAPAALVLGRTLSEGGAVRTSYADGHALAALQPGGVRCLIVVSCVGRDVIGIVLFVVVELREAGVQHGLESVQVHRVGIEHLLVDDFHPVPALLYVDLIGVCLLGLPSAPVDDVGVHPVVDGVCVTVVAAVELLYAAPRPAGMPLRVGEHLFPLRGIGVKSGIGRLEAHPLSAVQDAVVVRRGIVVAQRSASLFAPCDIPPLRVVVSRLFAHIVAHPAGQVVGPGLEQPGDILLSADPVEQHVPDAALRLFIDVGIVVVQGRDLAYLAVQQFVEHALGQQRVAEAGDARRSEADAHVVQVVNVALQLLPREVARPPGHIVQHPVPVHASQLREPQQRGYLPVDFEKHDV